MSLGVKTVWRAHACASAASGLSLSPRDLPRILPLNPRTRQMRWESTQATKSTRSNSPVETSETTKADELIEPPSIVRKVPPKPVELPAIPEEPSDVTVINASPSAVRRSVLRSVVKQRASTDSMNPVLVKPVQWYPSKHEVVRSVRKSYRSKAIQDLWAYAREREEKLGVDWRSVVSFLSKVTPKFGSIFDFKVTVGKGAAHEVRKLLPRGPTAEPGQLQQSTRALVRVDHVDNSEGTLHLTLTGSAHSVRMALLDLLKTSGHIMAVRVLDSDSQGMLRDLWQQQRNDLNSVKLLPLGETSSGDFPIKHTATKETQSDDRVLTLTREQTPSVFQLQNRRQYRLTRRADQIPRPTIWTRASVEAYIALLVYGVVPSDLKASLYKDHSDHQHIVVSSLMDIFNDEQARKSLTPNGLAMALAYIQDRKLAFRPAARAIFNQAEIHNLPLDTRICNLFLRGSAISGDLDGFDAMLKMMARKNLHADSESWISLLTLVEEIDAKRYILGKMRKKGLDRIQSAVVKAGRHMAPFELENFIKQTRPMKEFVEHQDDLHGMMWLNQPTLNRLVDMLGRHGKHGMIDELLNLVHDSRRTVPNAITLNAIITHNRSTRQILETIRMFQTRWPAATIFDEDTYDMLFRIAWKTRSPNMISVIWHYASFDRQASSKMKHDIHKFLRQDKDLGRMSMLKMWEGPIVGEAALTLLRSQHTNTLGATIARWHGAKAHLFKPTHSFGAKLVEAYETDRKLHAKIKEGDPMTASMREQLMVDIPLRRREYRRLSLVAPATKRTPEPSGGSSRENKESKLYLV
ncbi:hypothetical protein BKA67DRAFT_561129 [Truncatella angustata]|uniref:Pentatricopeptide repeat domain-containing protein n=1 Tax=Truncatella angustata TaxID=152316 RepID=A0A9P8UNR6_9PEZI|nr:uncharacterized protein BKA67DRAFT_561129 [Truncatella angustata]KAH6655578.1 hypothetical protein BKA67DRAFT_561129 [Truncatella angustata]